MALDIGLHHIFLLPRTTGGLRQKNISNKSSQHKCSQIFKHLIICTILNSSHDSFKIFCLCHQNEPSLLFNNFVFSCNPFVCCKCNVWMQPYVYAVHENHECCFQKKLEPFLEVNVFTLKKIGSGFCLGHTVYPWFNRFQIWITQGTILSWNQSLELYNLEWKGTKTESRNQRISEQKRIQMIT